MITEVRQALGSWELRLSPDTPAEILDQISPFGHVALVPGEMDVRTVGDGLLQAARYVGVYRGMKRSVDVTLKGAGMAFWLGDEDGKGDVLVNAVSVASASFANTVRALLPPGGAVTEGDLHSVPGAYTGTHQWQTPREALTYVTDTFSTDTYPVSWRVNGDGTLDAGRDADLYSSTPRAILVRRGAAGRDLSLVGLAGSQELETDVEDYSTGVILLAEGEGNSTATGSAYAPSVPYRDLHGNDVVLTRLVSESETSATNATARAQLQLNRFSTPRYAVALSTDAYDVKGDVQVGDRLAVFDPDNGFSDPGNEVFWQGVPINPIHLRCQEMTWPVPAGWTVAFRTGAGTWLDLSRYYLPETGSTQVVVGDFDRSLAGIGSEAVGTRPVADSSRPAVPVFGTAYTTNYTNPAGETRAQITLTWTEPLNTDGSTVLDGAHYEVRYRPNVTNPYPATWDEVSTDTWEELYTWDQPRVPPITLTDWQTVNVPWDAEQVTLQELLPAVVYEVQIRAVDSASPPNRSAWSATLPVTASRDDQPPSAPAAPEVAGSLLAVQVTHRLGRSDGGTFNLEADTHHLEVHVDQEPTFVPTQDTMVGALLVGAALTSQVPLVATFQTAETTSRYVKVVAVDRDGNRSNASPSASATAVLVDNAHITDLSVSKLTAGTMTADMLLAGAIRTAESGQRLELTSAGLTAYDSDGAETTNLASDPGVDGQFISFRSATGETVASIDSEGKVSGQEGYFPALYVAGRDILTDVIDRLPRGIVAWGSSLDDVTGAGPLTDRGYLELSFEAQEGRAYNLTMFGEVESTSSTAGERYIYTIRDGGENAPTVSSPEIGGSSFGATLASGMNDTGYFIITVRCPADITAGVHRLLWCFQARLGTATMRGSDGPAYFYVEDVGPSDLIDNTAILNDGGAAAGGGGSSVDPPAQVKTYTKTYPATWSGSYDGSKDFMSWQGSEIIQGVGPGGNGNCLGLVGFSSQIRSDLSGATVKSLTLTAYANHWYYNSGGTAVIGHHRYTSRPSAWVDSAVNEDEVRSSGWPKPGQRTIQLPASFVTAFKDGTAKGIAFGRGPSSSYTYYGRFNGNGASKEPYLTAVYTK